MDASYCLGSLLNTLCLSPDQTDLFAPAQDEVGTFYSAFMLIGAPYKSATKRNTLSGDSWQKLVPQYRQLVYLPVI